MGLGWLPVKEKKNSEFKPFLMIEMSPSGEVLASLLQGLWVLNWILDFLKGKYKVETLIQ